MGRIGTVLFLLFFSVTMMGQEGGCEPVDSDGDGYSSDVDCDDENANVNPGLEELCNGFDDNCDGVIDEGYDSDEDGQLSCAGDCDDSRDDIFAGAPEACDGSDNDCDGSVDEAEDSDADGVTLCEGDCDDERDDVFPGAEEHCNNTDNDCDGLSDEGFDLDTDGFSTCAGDCDDSNGAIYPGAEEICNGLDDDCQFGIDDGFDEDGDGYLVCALDGQPADCDDDEDGINPGAEEVCNGIDDNCSGSADEGLDEDGDGFLPCSVDGNPSDCDDTSATTYPGATESCDGQDNSCDGVVDEGFDRDNDLVTTCAGDCDDSEDSIYPGAAETCNGVDENCNGVVDEGFDIDSDGFTTCEGDCDDADDTVYPGATERCNLVDDDCDGREDEGYDLDGDGYVSCGGDCNDVSALVNPGVYEGIDAPASTRDGIDNDCDGYVDIDCDGVGGYGLPAVTLRSPSRGTYSSSDSIQVTGHAIPPENESVSYVELQGIEIPTQTCSSNGGAYFEADATLIKGVNTIEVLARDTDGGLDKAEFSLIQSDHFIDLSEEVIANSVVAEINEGTWGILADFLEGYLTEEMLEDELLAANPLIDLQGAGDCFEGYHIVGDATQYRQDGVEITFDIVKGKIVAKAKLLNPRIWASGYVYYDLEWFCGGFYDTFYVDAYASFGEVYAEAEGDIWVDNNGIVQARFEDVVVNVDDTEVAVQGDGIVYDFLLELFEDEMATQVESFIEAELEDFVEDDLGDLLADEINGLELHYDLAVLGTEYAVDFEFASVFISSNTVDLGMSVALDYDVDPRIPNNPGALSYDMDYSRTTDPTVAFKVGLDFFNGAMHALWEGGSLHVSGNLYDDPPIYGYADPLLPPIVTPGQGDWPLLLAVGDVLSILEIEIAPGFVETLSAAMAAQVPVDIQPIVDGYEIYFDVTFGTVDLSFDMLTDEALEPQLQANMEAGLSEMLTLYLDELEIYLESLRISYLPLPVVFTEAYVEPDIVNPAVLTVIGEAYYEP